MQNEHSSGYSITISQASGSTAWTSVEQPSTSQDLVLFSVRDDRDPHFEKQIALIEAEAESIGLPGSLDDAAAGEKRESIASSAYSLPSHVVSALREAIEFGEGDSHLVWIEFAGPLGYLPIVPWERLLYQHCGLLCVRMGAAKAPALPPSGSTDAILCFSCPIENADSSVQAVVASFLESLPTIARRTRLHIFADAIARAHLIALRHRFPENIETMFYEPEVSKNYADALQEIERAHASNAVVPGMPALIAAAAKFFGMTDRSRPGAIPTAPLENPWLVWMRDALPDCSIEYVHIVCHGHLGVESGGLRFAAPASTADTRWSRHVSARELDNFLDFVGAWSIGISSPPNDPATGGLRYALHELSALRTGPIMLHEMRTDGDRTGLLAGYGIFSGSEKLVESCAFSAWWAPNRLSRDAIIRTSDVTLNLMPQIDEGVEIAPEIVKMQRILESSLSQRFMEIDLEDDDIGRAIYGGVSDAISFTAETLRNVESHWGREKP